MAVIKNIDDIAYDEIDEPVEDQPKQTFEVGDKSYEIVFTSKRIELYEATSKRPIMATFSVNGGSLSISELRALTAYGLKLEGGAFVNPKQGMNMADALIKTSGYMAVYEAVIEAIQRDCGFLFMGVE